MSSTGAPLAPLITIGGPLPQAPTLPSPPSPSSSPPPPCLFSDAQSAGRPRLAEGGVLGRRGWRGSPLQASLGSGTPKRHLSDNINKEGGRGGGKNERKMSQNAVFLWKFHDPKNWKICKFYCQKFCCHAGGSY